MTFVTFQTFQASLQASLRELAAKQLALMQAFAEKQKSTFANPVASLTPQTFTENQAFVQEFVTANQAFLASSLLASQEYWRDQMVENQAALKAAGIPGISEVAQRVQEGVEKITTPAKASRAKR